MHVYTRVLLNISQASYSCRLHMECHNFKEGRVLQNELAWRERGAQKLELPTKPRAGNCIESTGLIKLRAQYGLSESRDEVILHERSASSTRILASCMLYKRKPLRESHVRTCMHNCRQMATLLYKDYLSSYAYINSYRANYVAS